MELGIGLAYSMASMRILVPHLGLELGIGLSPSSWSMYIYQQNHHLIWGTLELGLGIGLAHSLASMSILIPHLGIGIGYWIGSKFIEHVNLLTKSSSDMGVP